MMSHVILASMLMSVHQPDGIELQRRLEQLTTVVRVMYVAAHPDDENTQLLAYLTHGRRTRTAYLSLTRGDGGQNLIGEEQSQLLGVIRTYELLAARNVDGAEQLFTFARDFGYSKRADEALSIWGHDATLGDVVWAIRNFRPHVILTRFPEQGPTHGHHLASGVLAREAFTAAADPSRFPEQLERVATWKTERLLFNVPNRFMPEEQRPDDLVVDIGGFDPGRGASFGEIAAESRSMHKSQGFGAARKWGPLPERFRHLAGSRPEKDLLDGIDGGWRSVPGGGRLAGALDRAASGFRPKEPAASLESLADAWRAADEVTDTGARSWVQQQLAELMIASSGLLLEARSEREAVVPGDKVPVKLHLTVRGHTGAFRITSIDDEPYAKPLGTHERVELDRELSVAPDAPVSVLPWLAEPALEGRYPGRGDSRVPLPPPPLTVRLAVEALGVPIEVTLPVHKVWTDPVLGERRREVEILPPVTATAEGAAVMVPRGKQATLHVKLNVRGKAGGKVRFEPPAGFRVEPSTVEAKTSGDVEVHVSAIGREPAPGTLRIVVEAAGREWTSAEQPIAHKHIPLRTVLLPSAVHVAEVDLTVPSLPIGYLAGPGDQVASSLRRAGLDVREIDDKTLAHGDLDAYGAILVGIRAFNTRDAVKEQVSRLHAYAERGGTVVVQYTTVQRDTPLGVAIGPYPLEIERGRVTDETAAPEFLAPQHDLLRIPHTITTADFEGWVQERGLYFAKTWDPRYTPIVAFADKDEPQEKGALVVADVGKGRFVYTGLSFFRQLPAGVPGGYRLLVNLLARRDGGARAAAVSATEGPPILGSWRNLYLLVGGVLALLIVAFYALTRRYRP
jgi:LmbE family N-acetylglucosaminyl deacetylase